MRIQLSSDSPLAIDADLLVVGIASTSKRSVDVDKIDRALGGSLADWWKDEGFEAKPGQVSKLPARGRIKARWVVFVGIGGKDAVADARGLAHAATKASSRQKSAALVLSEVNVESVRAAAEALATGAYEYTTYKTGDRKPKGGLSKAFLVGADPKSSELKAALKAGKVVAEAVNLARDLVNAPPNDLHPVTFADIFREEAEKLGLPTTVWGKKELEKAGMNLFLAVNRGSAIEPRMVHVAYEPEGATQKVAFVGKGLTFDSGGLCIKPPKSMDTMKCDMAGAAATVGIVLAAAKLKLPVAVHAIIGCTENMTGAAAYRPGDVFTSLDGKTVEIINTDAEGRLVLADVLAWTRDTLAPDLIIDHATLTGACMVALGNYRAALYTADDELAKAYDAAAGAADEKFWRMPLDEDLRSTLDSSIADLKHVGGPYGGSITAALFLKEFVGKSRWMHLDIAGPAFLDGSHGRMPRGGTGFGVATAVRYLESLAGA
ncbi:MAG: leucyl aminopeptidase [Myxococcales bacterium]|nr:leucyl aminopeptidase [Myxococcales bacterium]